MSKPDKPKSKQHKRWSLKGDSIANLKAWRKQFTLEEMIKMAEEVDLSQIKMRTDEPAKRKRRAA